MLESEKIVDTANAGERLAHVSRQSPHHLKTPPTLTTTTVKKNSISDLRK